MPTLEIIFNDEEYHKLVKYCGGMITPEKAVKIMTMGYIRIDEQSRMGLNN